MMPVNADQSDKAVAVPRKDRPVSTFVIAEHAGKAIRETLFVEHASEITARLSTPIKRRYVLAVGGFQSGKAASRSLDLFSHAASQLPSPDGMISAVWLSSKGAGQGRLCRILEVGAVRA
jgi:hypothetical protein